MVNLRYSPNVCAYADEEHNNLNIEIELPGVNKKDIDFKIHEDSFYITATKEGMEYVGSYAVCCPVDPSKAVAKYENGMLRVTVPYKQPFEGAVKVKIE